VEYRRDMEAIGYVCKWKRGELGEIMKGDGVLCMSIEQRRVRVT
jgi:hypothetical protein